MTSIYDQTSNAVHNIENPNGAATYQLTDLSGIGTSGYLIPDYICRTSL